MIDSAAAVDSYYSNSNNLCFHIHMDHYSDKLLHSWHTLN